MCKCQKELAGLVFLRVPAVGCKGDGSLGEMVGDEAEKMVANDLGLGVK